MRAGQQRVTPYTSTTENPNQRSMSYPIVTVVSMEEIHHADVAITPAHRREIRTSLPESLRRLYCEVLADTLRNGVPVCASALAVVLGAHHAIAEEPLAFTGQQVEQLVWYAIADFCEDRELVVPAGCFEALHATLATATASSVLAIQSDNPRALFTALETLRAS